MEFFKVLTTLLVGIAWPVAAISIAFVFRGDIRGVIPRLRKAGPGGIELDAVQSQQASDENPISLALNLAPEPSLNEAVNLIETRLVQDLTAFDAAKQTPVLLRALAISRVKEGHEFTYNRIFGSQIMALKRLNEVGRATVDDARNFFTPYADQFPEIYKNYSFDSWLGFLVHGNLIIQTDNILQVSVFGRDFLMFLTERRLSENKPW